MIGIELARDLLDFGARLKASPQRAQEQLEGAVALHNLLERQRVAYLADEVGMGKTLVALGTIALFRHFQPGFRVLFLAPRENIQTKWQDELRKFVASNVRFADLRVRGLAGQPARPLVHCENLVALLRETVLDAERDFFARLTSFSLPIGREDESWTRIRDHVREQLPWLRGEALDARSKDNLARAICCAIPTFDLVVVDEAHNLKHGFAQGVAARNRVLALAMGHPRGQADPAVFRSYQPRALRVLFLSATPVEDSYHQLWNQLDVFGRGDDFTDLVRDDLDDEAKQRIVSRFLIRRVTSLRVAGGELTKNQYRREWRRGGVVEHDQPIRIDDDRQRLTVALVQKKVTELLGSERFANRFQIGMLASFESFLETAKLKREDDDASNFDDAEQADGADEREGIDVRDLNLLARSHFETFGRQMPHPKIDALVASLAASWPTGRKALVFVRRVASVKELKLKLEESYDEWLIGRLRQELPAVVRSQLERVIVRYHKAKREAVASRAPADEAGQSDTFFAWFFRGEGPRDVVSGASIARRFTNQGTLLATFFEDNHVAALLGARPGEVVATLASTLGLSRDDVRAQVRSRAGSLLGGTGRLRRGQRFIAAQGAAIQLLCEHPGPMRDAARVVWAERFHASARTSREAPESLADALEWATFFTELRARPGLCAALWPESPTHRASFRDAFRDRELRTALLGRTARLGHAFIDLYVLMIQRLGSLEQGAVEDTDDETTMDRSQIEAYLDLLEAQQRRAQAGEAAWGAYHELAELAENFDLVLDLNLPKVRHAALADLNREAGTLLGEQQPIGGMSGQVSQTLVRQFRMPGYPFVLISTDLLQEGEDLHAFCSNVYHYGISWTPSAMEQRIGRIDRVGSQTERRLTAQYQPPNGEHLLQVYFPHLEDTVEVLQVRKVLGRMNTFLRLMHEGLIPSTADDRRLDLRREMLEGESILERITARLITAFPIRPELLEGTRRSLVASTAIADHARARFERLRGAHPPDLLLRWEDRATGQPDGVLLGTAVLDSRVQPFALYLHTYRGRLLVRCISPVGRVHPSKRAEDIKRAARELKARVGAVVDEDSTYDLTVEDDVLLAAEADDLARVLPMVMRVVRHADALELEFVGGDHPLQEFAPDLLGELGASDD